MIAEALMMALTRQEEPGIPAKEMLHRTMVQVQRAKTFEASVEHHNSSSLFPGEFVQRLRWNEKAGFDLVVTERRNPPESLPDYYSRGRTVTLVYRDMRRMTQPSGNRSMISPGWEVTGGLNFSFLLKSSTCEMLFAEPKPLAAGKGIPPDTKLPDAVPTLSYHFGPRTQWKDVSVREIVATTSGENPLSYSIFIHPTNRYVLGMEMVAGGQTRWMMYRDIKINGEVPSDLGVPPGG